MRRHLESPLLRRHGLEPARVHLPTNGHWLTIRDFLAGRLAGRVTVTRIDEWLSAGRVVTADGPVSTHTPFAPGDWIWFHRDLPDEAEVPFSIDVVYRDESILVADKPHFMATIPRGRHVLQTALIRLRHSLDLPQLVPAHRLDRSTAGLVLFIVEPTHRGGYQKLFEKRQVHKTYEAIAPLRPDLELPRTVRSRIRKEHGTVAAFEELGEPNSESRVELIDARGGLGRYRLLPRTGKTHQLRLHMNGLGIPILGDDFFPTVTERPLDDFTKPLQLLAQTLGFTDPFTGVPREFSSRRSLAAWSDPADWLVTTAS